MRSAARKTKRALVIVTFALAGCRGPIEAPTATPEILPLYFVTTPDTAPLLKQLASAYDNDNDLIVIVEQAGISFTGTDAATLAPDILPPFALTKTQPGPGQWAAPLGQDGVAIVVHPQLSVAGLTATNLRDVFSGAATDWSELGWESQEIVVVSREAGADIRQAFEQQVMGQRRITLSARLATSDQATLAIVANTPGAVGYMSMAATDSRVRTVPVAATINDPLVMPTSQTVADGRYPLRMPLLIVGEEAPVPGDGYYEFIIWAQGEGQEVIARSYAPLP